MHFDSPLIAGKLIKRYKRFLADIELCDGCIITAHCPNTGAMRGLIEQSRNVLCSMSESPSRKYPYTLEGIEEQGVMVGINTQRPNALVYEGLQSGFFENLKNYTIQREVAIHAKTRMDFALTRNDMPTCFVEVKNVHYKIGEGAFFPDSVTTRGQKHLQELMVLRKKDYTCCMIYVIQRPDVSYLSFAKDIDPIYTDLAKKAWKSGVEMIAVTAEIDPYGLHLKTIVPVVF